MKGEINPRGTFKARTCFDEVIVCVVSEEPVGEEGDDRVNGRHVQDADAIPKSKTASLTGAYIFERRDGLAFVFVPKEQCNACNISYVLISIDFRNI